VVIERSGSFLGDDGRIRFILRQNTAGEFEVMERLLAGHARALSPDNIRFRRYVSGEFSPGVQFRATFRGGDALHAACVGQLLPVRYEPSFAVGRRVNARRRYANEQYQQQ
jgi:hypothetical protein